MTACLIYVRKEETLTQLVCKQLAVHWFYWFYWTVKYRLQMD